MKQQLEQIRRSAMQDLDQASNPAALEDLRVRLLGKKGELTAVLKQMGKLSPLSGSWPTRSAPRSRPIWKSAAQRCTPSPWKRSCATKRWTSPSPATPSAWAISTP